MNLAIYQNNTDKISYFIFDVVKTAPNDYRGSNIKLAGIKPLHYSFLYTNDTTTPILNKDGDVIGWNCKVSDLNPVPTYNDIPVGSPEEVDTITKNKISQQYPIQDEIKILRRKFNNTLPSSDWDAYVSYCETTVQQGKSIKVKL